MVYIEFRSTYNIKKIAPAIYFYFMPISETYLVTLMVHMMGHLLILAPEDRYFLRFHKNNPVLPCFLHFWPLNSSFINIFYVHYHIGNIQNILDMKSMYIPTETSCTSWITIGAGALFNIVVFPDDNSSTAFYKCKKRN